MTAAPSDPLPVHRRSPRCPSTPADRPRPAVRDRRRAARGRPDRRGRRRPAQRRRGGRARRRTTCWPGPTSTPATGTRRRRLPDPARRARARAVRRTPRCRAGPGRRRRAGGGRVPARAGARRAGRVQRLRDPAHPGGPVRRGGAAAASAPRTRGIRRPRRTWSSCCTRAATCGPRCGSRSGTRTRRRPDTIVALADVRAATGRADEAEALYRRAAVLGALRAHGAYGMFLLAVRGDAAAAEREFREARVARRARVAVHAGPVPGRRRPPRRGPARTSPRPRALGDDEAVTLLAEIDGEDPYDD